MAEQIFRRTEKILFEHVDAAGIVFYPNYFLMINRTVEDWFETALSCDYRELHQDRHLGIPTLHMDVSFLKPSRLGDSVEFQMRVLKLGRSSFQLEHQLIQGEEIRLRVEHKLVFADLNGIQSTPIPEDIRERMEQFLCTQS